MSAGVRVSLLGGFGITVDGTPVPEGAWRLRKAKSVIKVLALAPEHRLHRERVCELLWPDRDVPTAANNLHQALYVARRALDAAREGASAWLALRGETLALAHPAWLDTAAYERAAAAARKHLEISAYEQAVALYTGELLPEDRYEEWTVPARRALHELQLALLLELAELHLGAADRAAAMAALHQAVVHDPLDEEAHRRLIRLYAESGRRQQALAQYQQLRHSLRREFEAEPDPETRRLYQAVLSGGLAPKAAAPQAAAPVRRVATSTPRAAGPRLDNLPLQLTSFIGRERELEEVTRAVAATRLLTLTGVGGSGKTRLALELAAGLVGRFEHGVWFVELAGLTSPELVVFQVAGVLGLEVRSERDPLQGLVRHLRDREMLVVLDNCEHVIGAAAAVASGLLAGCERVKILATSREPLRVAGEFTRSVPPLALPNISGPLVRAELQRAPAIRLFCERAAAVRADFALSDQNLGAITQICTRLDGLPLAIELAAARIRVLSPAQIAERLGDALALLAGGRREAEHRQSTLEATLRWSHDLLAEHERVMFRRLAVFSGSFELEAAEAVCGGDAAVIDTVERLVDRCLVVADEVDGAYRYRLLETIRQYGRLKLREAGEETLMEDRHRDWFLALAARSDPHQPAGPLALPTARLEQEHDNFRAALGVALEREPQAALKLALHLSPFWMTRGYFTEGDTWLDESLRRAPEATAARAAALHASCGFGIRRGRVHDLVERLEAAVAICRQLGEPRALGHALEQLANMHWARGEMDVAEEIFEELGQRVAEHRLIDVEANVRHARSLLAYGRGNYDAAAASAEEGIALMAQVPPELGPVFWIRTPGLVVSDDLGSGRPRMFYEETILHFRRVLSTFAVSYLRCDLALAVRAAGELNAARDLLEQALSEFRDAGDESGVAFALCALGNLARTAGEYELARDTLEEALALRRRLGDQRAIRITLGNLGCVAFRAGEPEEGRRLLGEAIERSERSDDEPAAAAFCLSLGGLELDAGELKRAVPLLARGGHQLDRQWIARGGGWAWQTLAEALLASGDAARAAHFRALADETFTRLGDTQGLAALTVLDARVGSWGTDWGAAKSTLSGRA